MGGWCCLALPVGRYREAFETLDQRLEDDLHSPPAERGYGADVRASIKRDVTLVFAVNVERVRRRRLLDPE